MIDSHRDIDLLRFLHIPNDSRYLFDIGKGRVVVYEVLLTVSSVIVVTDNSLHHEYKEDPILIPATEVKKWFWEPGDPVVAPMHSVVDLTVYTNMPGLAKNHNKVGASWVIDPTHDYTESEIRARLQQGFKAMEELIIKSLKENKK